MTAPITGPFTVITTRKWPNPGGYEPVIRHDLKTWYRQRRPHNLPLIFTREYKDIIFQNGGREYYQSKAYEKRMGDAATLARVKNKAYSRFVELVKSDQASLGAALGERRKSMEMIANRCLQLHKFVRAVKKFRFGDAAKALGLSKSQIPKGVRGKGKAFASNVLEYSFGWAPLVSDIGNAVDTLQKGVPPPTVRGRASEPWRWSSSTQVGDSTTHIVTQVIKVQYGAKVQVSNPNLFLANQLGFVNPASVVWELIPFSFLVDYVVNVSDFLSSFTDLWGVSLIDPYATETVLTQSNETLSGQFINPPRGWQGDCRIINRRPGPIPGPTIRLQPWSLSPKRALTSVALLLQQLR
jgi:hypothetical protein